MATSTVEDYLKCIHREERAGDRRLVSTGRIAQQMSVAPGTVTAMVKTLTESGLVDYEPYMGVRLTERGRLLAVHVLRRHRLIELFLVRIMGMDWSEVHEEAEVLEHAVSDRLIARIDEMLDHPTADPHGDPIPSSTGRLDEIDHPSLLICPLERELNITRVTDQRTEFLQLLEQHQLMPGRRAFVEQRDEITETEHITTRRWRSATTRLPRRLENSGGERLMAEQKSHLSTSRVLLEACPPAETDRDKAYAVLQQSFTCYNSFHAVSIPDLQDAGEFQRIRLRVTNDEFAAYLGQLTEKPLSLYKVCASVNEEQFLAWLKQAEALGCQDIFLVGPDAASRVQPENSLDVPHAARLAKERGFRCGGIIIPTRRKQFSPRPASVDETDRLLMKVREHGLRFFTTQILYEGEWMSCLLLDLVRQMKSEELPQIFLTFSPFVCPEDLQFSRKTLGVYIPKDVSRQLRGSRSMREASISHSLLLWERISSFAQEIGYPKDRLGVNVEYLDSRNPRNVDAAFELAEEFGRVLRRR